MTRKAERRRRVGRWLGTMTAGAGGALVAAWLGAGTAALLPLAAAAAIGHRGMIAPPGTVILTYHSVAPNPGWLPWAREIAVHPTTLERHLATLARMGCTPTATRAHVAARAAGTPPRGGQVILHFDDGYRDNWVHAAPLLDRYDWPATFFVSLDFVEPGDAIRPRDPDACGYMNWAEIAALEAHPRFEVEPHGVDHARVATSARTVTHLTAGNWRTLAWLQWAAMPGPKHDWYRADTPPAVPLGTPVPESGLALATRAWVDDALEAQPAFERRIERDLARCNRAFAERLGRAPQIFCWPENRVGADGRRIAATLGYRATTGGAGRNTADEPAEILSRIHMGDRALGFRWLPAEGLHLRAAVRLAAGNHYWYFVIAPMNALRRVVMGARDRLGYPA